MATKIVTLDPAKLPDIDLGHLEGAGYRQRVSGFYSLNMAAGDDLQLEVSVPHDEVWSFDWVKLAVNADTYASSGLIRVFPDMDAVDLSADNWQHRIPVTIGFGTAHPAAARDWFMWLFPGVDLHHFEIDAETDVFQSVPERFFFPDEVLRFLVYNATAGAAPEIFRFHWSVLRFLEIDFQKIGRPLGARVPGDPRAQVERLPLSERLRRYYGGPE